MVAFTLMRLTVEGILSDVPRDGAAIVTYALLVLFLAFVWSGNRTRA